MTYDELAKLLEPAGVNVVGPGHPMVALPAITLEPTGLSVFEGYRVVYRECNVVVRYPLGEGGQGQFGLMEKTVHRVLGIIAGSPVQFEPEIDIFADGDSTPAAIKSVIGARFPGDDICPPPGPTPNTEPEPEPEPEPPQIEE